MKRWLRRARRRWLIWWRGTWRERFIRCRLCRGRYHRDIWPPPESRLPARQLYGHLKCGHTMMEARTGYRCTAR